MSVMGLFGNRKVHFSVAMTGKLEGRETSQPIRFDKAFSREPEEAFAVEEKASEFICPRPGSYFFTFSIRADQGKSASVQLVKNQTPQVMNFVDMNDNNTGVSTQTVILNLQTGDKVWLRLDGGTDYGLRSHPLSPMITFTGINLS